MQDAVPEIVHDQFLGGLGQRRGVGDDGLQKLWSVTAAQAFLQGENAVKMGGHHEHAGHLPFGQPSQHQLRIKVIQDLHVAAQEYRRQSEGQPRAMGHGREGEVSIIGGVATVLRRLGHGD